MRVRQRGTLPMIELMLTNPATSGLAAFAYVAMIWLLLDQYGGPR